MWWEDVKNDRELGRREQVAQWNNLIKNKCKTKTMAEDENNTDVEDMINWWDR